jgi:hypothetical protein
MVYGFLFPFIFIESFSRYGNDKNEFMLMASSDASLSSYIHVIT